MHRFLLGFFILGVCSGLAFCLPPVPAMAQCVTNNSVNGLISNGNPTLGITGLGNPTGSCVNDTSSSFTVSDIPTYADYKQRFYDLPKSFPTSSQHGFTYPAPFGGDVFVTNTRTDLDTSENTVYSLRGSLVIDDGKKMKLGNAAKSVAVVMFIDGNLHINNNIEMKKSGSSNFADGIVFVVNGVVKIDPSVTQIDAVILAYGNTGLTCTSSSDLCYSICTAIDTSSGNCPVASVDLSREPAGSNLLTVNGTLASLNDNHPIRFRRNLANNSQAAEKIIFEPKYLLLLKDAFSESKKIQSEVADYKP